MFGELVGVSTGGELLLKKRSASSRTDSMSSKLSTSMGDCDCGDVCEGRVCVDGGNCGGEDGGVVE